MKTKLALSISSLLVSGTVFAYNPPVSPQYSNYDNDAIVQLTNSNNNFTKIYQESTGGNNGNEATITLVNSSKNEAWRNGFYISQTSNGNNWGHGSSGNKAEIKAYNVEHSKFVIEQDGLRNDATIETENGLKEYTDNDTYFSQTGNRNDGFVKFKNGSDYNDTNIIVTGDGNDTDVTLDSAKNNTVDINITGDSNKASVELTQTYRNDVDINVYGGSDNEASVKVTGGDHNIIDIDQYGSDSYTNVVYWGGSSDNKLYVNQTNGDYSNVSLNNSSNNFVVITQN